MKNETSRGKPECETTNFKLAVGRWPFYIAALLSVLLCGCIEYDERIELNADMKTGVLKMHLAVSEQVLGLPPPKDKSVKEIFGLTVDELKAEIDSPALSLTSVRADVSKGMRHLYVVCRIKDASKLTTSPALAERKLVLEQTRPDHWRFSQELVIPSIGSERTGEPVGEKSLARKGTLEVLKKLEASIGRKKVIEMLSRYHLTFSISVPEGFVPSVGNGRVHRQSAVVWKKSLDQLVYPTDVPKVGTLTKSANRQSWKMETHFVRKK